jgi:membrane fusion protein (multidrug efflux system)
MIDAAIAGTVISLDLSEGAAATQGQVLARIDDSEARAAVEVATARFRQAQEHLRRIRKLREDRVTSEQELDDAISAFHSAKGTLAEANARQAKTSVRAPFDGILGLRKISLGDYAEIGDPIVEISQTDPLELVFGLPQRFAADVATGQTVRATTGRCGEKFVGRVVAVDPVVDTATRTLRIQAAVPNPKGTLLPGMAAQVRLEIGEIPDAIIIPREAIIRQGTKHIVYTLDENDHAQYREVTLGEFFAAGVHVTTGIASGDRVVVSGHQKLRPNTPTLPTAFEPTQNPNLELGWLGPTGDCQP